MSGVQDRLRFHDREMLPTVEEFEAGSLDPEAFDHAAHVYIAWQLLEENSLSRAAFAASNPDLLGPVATLLEQYYSRDRLWSDLAI